MSNEEYIEISEEGPTMYTIFFVNMREDETHEMYRVSWINEISDCPIEFDPPGDVWFTTYVNHGRVMSIILVGEYHPELDLYNN